MRLKLCVFIGQSHERTFGCWRVVAMDGSWVWSRSLLSGAPQTLLKVLSFHLKVLLHAWLE